MTKMIQIRNVPDDLHRQLKARAAREGTSLSDYLLREVGEIASKPTLAEWVRDVENLDPVEFDGSAADLIRANRPS